LQDQMEKLVNNAGADSSSWSVVCKSKIDLPNEPYENTLLLIILDVVHCLQPVNCSRSFVLKESHAN
jgi:hypothetical protein